MKIDKRFLIELGVAIAAGAGLLFRKWWKFHIVKQYFCPELFVFNYYGCKEQFVAADISHLKDKDKPFGSYTYFWADELPNEDDWPEDAIPTEDGRGFVINVPNGYILFVKEKGKGSWCWAEEMVEAL